LTFNPELRAAINRSIGQAFPRKWAYLLSVEDRKMCPADVLSDACTLVHGRTYCGEWCPSGLRFSDRLTILRSGDLTVNQCEFKDSTEVRRTFLRWRVTTNDLGWSCHCGFEFLEFPMLVIVHVRTSHPPKFYLSPPPAREACQLVRGF
jgi:hypothetical protein